MAGWLLNLGAGGGPPSRLLLPSLPGVTYSVLRGTHFATDVQKAISGKTSRMAFMRWPRVSWRLTFSLLRDDASVAVSEFRQLVGMFNDLQGRAGSFLYSDPLFNSVTDMAFGTGDGFTTQFQLNATYQANTSSPGTAEIIQNLNGSITNIKDNGSIVSSALYSVDANGLVTFTTAPVLGDALTWSGAFYYQCAFDDDSLDFSEFVGNWWELGALNFTSVLR